MADSLDDRVQHEVQEIMRRTRPQLLTPDTIAKWRTQISTEIDERVPATHKSLAIQLMSLNLERLQTASARKSSWRPGSTLYDTHPTTRSRTEQLSFQGYELLGDGPIGLGATSEVWLARSRFSNKHQVLKFFAAESDQLPNAVIAAAAVRESQVHHRLKYHPNVVKVYNTGWVVADDGKASPFIAMEYLDGCSLGEWLKRRSLSAKAAAEVVLTLACALDELTEDEGNVSGQAPVRVPVVKILHLDVNPRNIMVVGGASTIPSKTTLKLIDFGASGVGDDVENMAQEGYAAPERLVRGCQPSEAWDVYSLGAVLFSLLTRQEPQQQRLDAPPIAFDTALANVDKTLGAICAKAMAVQHKERYASRAELARDLQLYLNDEPVTDVGVAYTAGQTFGLLVSRCKQPTNIRAQSRLIAYGCIVMALSSYCLSTLSYVLTLFGVSALVAAWATSLIHMPILLATLGSLAWITRFQEPVRRVWLYLVSYIVAFLIFAIVVCDGNPIVGGGFQFLLTALITVYMGLATPQWRWWHVLGWIFLGLSPLAAYAARQPWYPPLYPVFQGWQQGTLFLVFAGASWWESEANQAGRVGGKLSVV